MSDLEHTYCSVCDTVSRPKGLDGLHKCQGKKEKLMEREKLSNEQLAFDISIIFSERDRERKIKEALDAKDAQIASLKEELAKEKLLRSSAEAVIEKIRRKALTHE